MKIKELKLKNFRNHNSFEIKFENDSSILIGKNGAGKTNVLEAVHLLSTGKSSRAKYDKDLINYEKDFCSVEAIVERSDEAVQMQLQVLKENDDTNRSKKKYKLNKLPKTYSSFIGKLNSVIFAPENIRLLTGSPSRRRNYLDNVIRQVDPKYKKASLAYIKAVRHRNKILEKISEISSGKDYLEYWTNKILIEGLYIQERRKEMIDFFEELFSKYGKELNNKKTEISIEYLPNLSSEERLKKYFDKEVQAKTTLIGPHRDEFSVKFDNYNISEFGSRGQQRSTLLALKMCEIDYIEHNNKERPVLLLDDIFSELDIKHQQAVMEIIPKQQTIITSTDLPPFINGFQKIFL